MNALNTLISLLNIAPGFKTKAAALAAFGLAIIAAWNTLVPEFGYGPCELTPEMVTAGVKTCGVNLTVTVPEFINAAVLALLGVGAANQPTNAAAKK